MRDDKITWLVGDRSVSAMPQVPFSEDVCAFLDALSKVLRSYDGAKAYPDIQTFAFWIRKAHLSQLKEKMYQGGKPSATRLGRGLIFHIAPSNVPINFAYTMVFGMLSGNSNVVRVSSKEFPQVTIICECLNQLIEEKYPAFKNQISIVRYEADQEITDYFSSLCHGRVVWGGDKTIQEIRTSPLGPRAVELNFADRYSFGVIDAQSILTLSDKDLNKLALDFYNDTYLMDQNACSAPHFIFWKAVEGSSKEARQHFWQAVYQVAKTRYSLESVKVVDKFTELYHHLATGEDVDGVRCLENYLYVVTLKKLHASLECHKGKFGLFYEMEFSDYSEILPYVSNKIQTCSYYGIDRNEMVDWIIKDHLTGIDRIVPFGTTLDMELAWDGYDIIGSLSRIIG